MRKNPKSVKEVKSERGDGPSGGGKYNTSQEPGTTGRHLVLFRKADPSAHSKFLNKVAGLSATNVSDHEPGVSMLQMLETADAALFDKLGVAVIDAPQEKIDMIRSAPGAGDEILHVRKERVLYAWDNTFVPGVAVPRSIPSLGGPAMPLDYLRGYRDAVDQLVERIVGSSGAAELGVAALDEAQLTWGLQATNVAASPFSGKGIRVAVLDTGLDLQHPDFVGRQITANSFVPGATAQDGHGHGTHCVGTSCGPKQPGQLPRYGIAYEAEIFVGKVLSDQGSGAEGDILNGLQWAIGQGCAVISMSLGSPVSPGQQPDPIFEQVAKRALAAGTLIVAAAGNDSRRPGDIEPVGHPANCPSVLAVGALDQQFAVAFFSNGGVNPQGGGVDVAAPGVDVRSSWPAPKLYNTISGTSMATPHVAGIAALLAEANPSARGNALWALLTQHAKRLNLPARDIGSGLEQAPQ
jgi:subtilisin